MNTTLSSKTPSDWSPGGLQDAQPTPSGCTSFEAVTDFAGDIVVTAKCHPASLAAHSCAFVNLDLSPA